MILRYDPAGSPPIDDLLTFAPHVTAGNVDNIDAYLQQAQEIAEGPFGADRTLEKRQIGPTMIDRLLARAPGRMAGALFSPQQFRLRVTPVASIVKLEGRVVGSVNPYRLGEVVGDWITLTSTQYSLEGRSGLVILKAGSPQLGLVPFNQARVTYFGGYDFSVVEDDADLEAAKRKIRAATGLILEALLGIDDERDVRSVGERDITFEPRPQGEDMAGVPRRAARLLADFRPATSMVV